MSQQVRGVVSAGKGEPVSVQTVVVPDPGPGEAVVAVQACGVCHTDLHYKEGAINDDFPFLLGHEAAGIVESVGAGVANVAPGDYVVLAWRAPCGTCRSCLRGRPWYCFDSRNAAQPMTLEDGTALSPALGIGAFVEKTLVAAGQCVPVDRRARPEAAGLIGCGIMAGWGAAANTGQVGRGDTVAVIGCGGVGCAAIAASALNGARTVIAVDVDPRKLETARRFGATDTVDAREVDVIDRVRELTGGFGADLVIEAVGRPETYRQAFYARDHAGTLVQVGVPDPAMRLELPLIDFFSRGGALRSSWYGDCLPTRDFPILVDAYLAGKLDLDGFVSETIPLDGVEEAFATMVRGDVLRSVVVF
ncbi:MAG TPA: S-(hydroxymethyl)mycothiol dehydrogenase [Mycobacteriales bacterium]|jgi:S-(hydroxymethyl)mycothiol dehydrogenase|nr:S-(hydroxymethyl)mycothiol dehydrogenase [Mycobacteriales bacterium]